MRSQNFENVCATVKPWLQMSPHLDGVVEGLKHAHALGAELQVHHPLHGERDALVLHGLLARQHHDTCKHLLGSSSRTNKAVVFLLFLSKVVNFVWVLVCSWAAPGGLLLYCPGRYCSTVDRQTQQKVNIKGTTNNTKSVLITSPS